VYPVGSDSPAVRQGKVARYPLRRGDKVRLITGVGGGYGDPLTRAPQLVRADLRDGFINARDARHLYGVAIDPDTLAIDETVTGRLRREKRGARPESENEGRVGGDDGDRSIHS